MLDLLQVTLRIAGRTLLDQASLHLPAGSRMALVGRNGTGKSSLLKLIAGELQADGGDLRLQSGARLGMIAQEAPGGQLSPLEAVLASDRERASLLAEAPTATDPHRIAEIQTRLVDIHADSAPARAARILNGLGFDSAAQERPLSSFSGGWRMRVALAAVLFLEPDLLLLDEPTNHLDLEATLWLEDYLRRYPRTLLIVSHDRDLLDEVPDRICHLNRGKLDAYSGNYSSFERVRAEKAALLEKERAKQEVRRAHLQSFVDRFRYKASKARQAQSRIKMLEKMGSLAEAVLEPDVVFDFPAGAVPAPPLVTMEGARAGYGDHIVLDRLALRIDPDDRIALLGRNGNGKSTFAKLVAGRLQEMAGEITRARNLTVGFFAQHQIEDLDPEADAIRHIERRRRRDTEQQIRGRLARFGLGVEKARTPAKSLSGGEKTRLALCLMCLDPPHLLILDEPTNHLDIDSRDALVNAINEFPGAVIVVSHDRHLVELTADTLWLVADGRVRPYEGDLEDYRKLLLETSREQRNGPDTVPATNGAAQDEAPARPPSGAARRAKLAPLRKRAKEFERTVEKLAVRRGELERRLADPSTYGGPEDEIVRLNRQLAQITNEIETTEGIWLETEAEIEAIERA